MNSSVLDDVFDVFVASLATALQIIDKFSFTLREKNVGPVRFKCDRNAKPSTWFPLGRFVKQELDLQISLDFKTKSAPVVTLICSRC